MARHEKDARSASKNLARQCNYKYHVRQSMSSVKGKSKFSKGTFWLPAALLLLTVLLAGCGNTPIREAAVPLPTLAGQPPTLAPAQPTPTLAPFAPTIPPPTVSPQLLTAGDPYMPQLGNSGYDVQRYLLRLGLDPAVRAVNGFARIEGVTTQSLHLLTLDFVGFQVTAVHFNGIPATYARQNDKLLITLPRAVPADSAFVLDVAYGGAPSARRSLYAGFVPALGLQFVDDNLLYALGEPDGARFGFPATIIRATRRCSALRSARRRG
jgi:hypothetical protein